MSKSVRATQAASLAGIGGVEAMASIELEVYKQAGNLGNNYGKPL